MAFNNTLANEEYVPACTVTLLSYVPVLRGEQGTTECVDRIIRGRGYNMDCIDPDTRSLAVWRTGKRLMGQYWRGMNDNAKAHVYLLIMLSRNTGGREVYNALTDFRTQIGIINVNTIIDILDIVWSLVPDDWYRRSVFAAVHRLACNKNPGWGEPDLAMYFATDTDKFMSTWGQYTNIISWMLACFDVCAHMNTYTHASLTATARNIVCAAGFVSDVRFLADMGEFSAQSGPDLIHAGWRIALAKLKCRMPPHQQERKTQFMANLNENGMSADEYRKDTLYIEMVAEILRPDGRDMSR